MDIPRNSYVVKVFFALQLVFSISVSGLELTDKSDWDNAIEIEKAYLEGEDVFGFLWKESLYEALEEAKEKDKKIVVFLGPEWCPFSQKNLYLFLNRTTSANRILKKYIPVRYQGENLIKLSGALHVTGYPVTLILDSDGRQLFMASGLPSYFDFVTILSNVHNGQPALSNRSINIVGETPRNSSPVGNSEEKNTEEVALSFRAKGNGAFIVDNGGEKIEISDSSELSIRSIATAGYEIYPLADKRGKMHRFLTSDNEILEIDYNFSGGGRIESIKSIVYRSIKPEELASLKSFDAKIEENFYTKWLVSGDKNDPFREISVFKDDQSSTPLLTSIMTDTGGNKRVVTFEISSAEAGSFRMTSYYRDDDPDDVEKFVLEREGKSLEAIVSPTGGTSLEKNGLELTDFLIAMNGWSKANKYREQLHEAAQKIRPLY